MTKTKKEDTKKLNLPDEETPSPFKPGDSIKVPSRETRYKQSQISRASMKRDKTGRKGRTTISENNQKALLEKRRIEVEEKKRKLAEKEINDKHVAHQMMQVQSRLLARPVSPEDVARIRTDLHNIVVSETERARLFLEGKSEWNSNQVRLYGMLLNKVMPDLSQKFTEVSIERKDVKELSRAELESIIYEAEAISDADIETIPDDKEPKK